MRALLRNPFADFRVSLALSTALLVALCLSLYLREARQIESSNLDRETRRVHIYATLFSHDLGGIVSDVRLLSTGDGITAYVNRRDPEQLQRAINHALNVSSESPDYDQIRYIDQTGREVFRVNRHGEGVLPAQLQDKSGGAFFKQANALAPGQIFISPIDLNVEHGRVELPLKPTLRVAVPLFDAGGHHRGIYLINYLVEPSVERLRQFLPLVAGRLRLLNPDGYWLAGGQSGDEWGFMLPGREGDTLAQGDPALWSRVRAEPAGQEPYRGGYFTWCRGSAADAAVGKTITIVPGEKFVIFASVITPSEWAASLRQLRQTFVIVALLLLTLLFLVSWFLRAQRRAQQESDRFFTLTGDVLCIVGFDGRLRRVNPAWEETLGFRAEDVAGLSLLDFVHPDDREKTRQEFERLAHGQEVVSLENRCRARDGCYRSLHWNARGHAWDRVYYASARDTTERRRIEEKLRQANEQSRLMLEAISDYAVFMLAPDGRVISWNPAAERILGYTSEEILGQPFSRFQCADQGDERAPYLELQAAAETGRFEEEAPRVRKDGSRFWANVVTTPMRDDKGELIGFVKVTRDVTRRRESALRIELLNEELHERAEQLEIANRELEAFSYSVSHDLRAPLRHISGFVELLQKSSAPERDATTREYMIIIAKAAKDMGQLIDDLLEFSRTGRAEMHAVTISTREMVDRAIRSLEMETAGRHIVWDIGPLGDVEGDPGLLRLVWANLLNNAVKYTRPRAEARIEIGQLAPSAEGSNPPGEVVSYVRDNGVGFDMKYATDLFGVFQRMHSADDFEGSGIGLANVQKIVQRHGGRVWAEAQTDAGATFYFSLPAAAARKLAA